MEVILMNNKIIFLMCLLMAMVWTSGCACFGREPAAAAPPPAVVEPAPAVVTPAPQPEVIRPKAVEEPAPSKKLKKRVIKETD
jgi:hypothetical protein